MRNLKTKFLSVLAFTLSLPLTVSAADQKHIGDYLFNCNVSFNATGKSAYFLLGYTHLKGTGTLSCYSFAKDQTENIPLEVVVKGPGVGMGVTGFNVSGGAMGVGINDSPDAMLGKYVMVRGNAAVGVGAGAGASFRLSKGSIQLNLNVNSASGLGAGVDFVTVELSRHPTLKPEIITASAAPKVKEEVKETPKPAKEVIVKVGEIVVLVDQEGREVRRYRFNAQ